jgi:hypothetical protein
MYTSANHFRTRAQDFRARRTCRPARLVARAARGNAGPRGNRATRSSSPTVQAARHRSLAHRVVADASD